MAKLPIHDQGLAAALDESFSARGELWTSEGKDSVRCHACAHRCFVAPGSRGACGVRFNDGGELRVPFGYVARRYVRAVETNTIFHVMPGARALTFGLFGCDLRCPYCHNHRLSQALRDGPSEEQATAITPEELVTEAVASGCAVICAAYNEPLISAEWNRRVFEVARARGLLTALVSDGHSTPEVLRYMRPSTDVFRVDLKAHDETAYRKLGGRLEPVLRSIALAKELGYWVEAVSLVVPGINHDPGALALMGKSLRDIDATIPWHLNAFVPRYRMRTAPPADPLLLLTAAGAAYLAGSRFVYVGNEPGCAELAHTRCPRCRNVVIRRRDYATLEHNVSNGSCGSCGEPLPGLWSAADR